jgi:hypothetical protein
MCGWVQTSLGSVTQRLSIVSSWQATTASGTLTPKADYDPLKSASTLKLGQHRWVEMRALDLEMSLLCGKYPPLTKEGREQQLQPLRAIIQLWQNLLSGWAHRHLSLSQGPLTVMPRILPL